jgi:multidrug efflux pump subunit AcrB
VFSTFFIERPIFANVIAIVTILVGVVALQVLPVEQYPEITPPTVQVAAIYPGASAGRGRRASDRRRHLRHAGVGGPRHPQGP